MKGKGTLPIFLSGYKRIMRYPNIDASVKSILLLLLLHYNLWNKINAPKKSQQMRKQFVKNCKKWYTLNIKLIYKKGLTFF